MINMLLPIPASGPNRGPNPPSKLESGYRRIPTARPVKPIIVIAPLIRNIHQYGLLFFILSLLVQRQRSGDSPLVASTQQRLVRCPTYTLIVLVVS